MERCRDADISDLFELLVPCWIYKFKFVVKKSCSATIWWLWLFSINYTYIIGPDARHIVHTKICQNTEHAVDDSDAQWWLWMNIRLVQKTRLVVSPFSWYNISHISYTYSEHRVFSVVFRVHSDCLLRKATHQRQMQSWVLCHPLSFNRWMCCTSTCTSKWWNQIRTITIATTTTILIFYIGRTANRIIAVSLLWLLRLRFPLTHQCYIWTRPHSHFCTAQTSSYRVAASGIKYGTCKFSQLCNMMQVVAELPALCFMFQTRPI